MVLSRFSRSGGEQMKILALAQSRGWEAFLLFCCLFIISGAVNAGATGFYLAIPFMLATSWISLRVIKNTRVTYFAHSLIFLSIIFNVTLTKNPLIFPIIDDGHIEIVSDGYYVTYIDGSGGFTTEKSIKVDESQVSYKRLNKGERYKVNGIKISMSGLSSVLLLQTEIGTFSEIDYQNNGNIEANVLPSKEVYVGWARSLSVLMYWPTVFMMIFNAFTF